MASGIAEGQTQSWEYTPSEVERRQMLSSNVMELDHFQLPDMTCQLLHLQGWKHLDKHTGDLFA